MCGIVGYTGRRDAAPVLVDGLLKLEYRGYDSFGIATVGDELNVLKKTGRISESKSSVINFKGNMGIGHTRWATHGKPDDTNAHPHMDCTGKIAVVHNGIIENYADLRRELTAKGHHFASETDSEVIAHLIEDEYDGDLLKSVSNIVKYLEGSYAILAVAENNGSIVAARNRSPLVLGVGDDEFLASSDPMPILEYTRSIIYLEDGDVASLSKAGVEVYNNDGWAVKRPVEYVDWDVESAKKGGFEHFMIKEIFEQPDVYYNTLTSIENAPEIVENIHKCSSLVMVACGTSYHSSMVFRYLMEQWCEIPVRVELASEFRYFTCPPDSMVVAVTQSGETADTLTAVRKAKAHNCRTLAITNVVGSSVTRLTDQTIYTRAGPEISVAATKSFTSQLAVFFSLANMVCNKRSDEQLLEIRQAIEETLLLDVSQAVSVCSGAENIFFVGRGPFYPASLEGALKMKEITYIHAEGYAAGELKHGPFSLLSEKTPVVAICTPGDSYAGMLSNIREMKSRDAPIIGIGWAGDRDVEEYVDVFIPLSHTHLCGDILTASVVLQMLAYYTAKALGRDIDKPRNLAKSVTVE